MGGEMKGSGLYCAKRQRDGIKFLLCCYKDNLIPPSGLTQAEGRTVLLVPSQFFSRQHSPSSCTIQRRGKRAAT